MAIYLVRTISNRRLVGLFYAESLPHLVVDASRAASTEDLEFIELGGGAIFWKNSTIEIPMKNGGTIPWNDSQITDNWREALQDADAEWIPLLTPEDIVRGGTEQSPR
jgi:hypothetical protein